MKSSFKPLWAFLIAIMLLIGLSCRKTDQTPQQSKNTTKLSEVENKFFNSHRTADPTEKALVDFIKRKNDKEKFVEKTVSQIGYPRWDKAVTTKKNNGTAGRGGSDSSLATYYIPFVRDSQNYVNASIIIETFPADTAFSYKCDWQYSRQQNNINSYTDSAEYYAIFFMVLDKIVFGYQEFTITDTTLFKHDSHTPLRIKLENTHIGGKSNLLELIDFCQDVTVSSQDCPWLEEGLPCGGPGGSCDNCWQCTSSITWTYCWSEWIETGGGGGTGGTGGTGGGGSGDGEGSTPPECGGGGPVGGKGLILEECEPGWEPGGGNYIPEFVPYDIDPGSNDDPNYYPSGIFYENADISGPGLTQKAKDHILKGEVYPDGNVAGFHYVGNLGITGKIRQGTSKSFLGPPQYGMFKAFVDIKRPDGSWKPKAKASTFFPPSWTEAKIIQEINNAYNGNKTQIDPTKNLWLGYTSEGIPIVMALRPNNLNGSIVSAYPYYP